MPHEYRHSRFRAAVLASLLACIWWLDLPLDPATWDAYAHGSRSPSCPRTPCDERGKYYFRWKPSHCSIVGNVLPSYFSGRSVAATARTAFSVLWYPRAYVSKHEPDGCRIMWRLPRHVPPQAFDDTAAGVPHCSTACQPGIPRPTDWTWLLGTARREVQAALELAMPLLADDDLSMSVGCVSSRHSSNHSCRWDVIVHFRCGDIRRTQHGSYGFLGYQYYTHAFRILGIRRARVLILTHTARHARRLAELPEDTGSSKRSCTVTSSSDCTQLVDGLRLHLLGRDVHARSVEMRGHGSIDADLALMLVGSPHLVAAISTFSMLAGLLKPRGASVLPDWPALDHQLGIEHLRDRMAATGHLSTQVHFLHGHPLPSAQACRMNASTVLSHLRTQRAEQTNSNKTMWNRQT